MSGVAKRVKLIFEAKANRVLERYEDPAALLDLSYEKQRELLMTVRRGVAEVATARKRLEIQSAGLQRKADELESQARRALAVGREDLAREALSRRTGLTSQISDLQTQHSVIRADEERLVRAVQTLEQRIDAFRTKKETLKATYAAAEAQTRIGEAVAGIGSQLGDVGELMQRAEDKTLEMQARSLAIGQLMESGALSDPLGIAKTDIERELDQLSAGPGVEGELARLRREISGGAEAARAIESGPRDAGRGDDAGRGAGDRVQNAVQNAVPGAVHDAVPDAVHDAIPDAPPSRWPHQ
jgi:phage shock protein A